MKLEEVLGTKKPNKKAEVNYYLHRLNKGGQLSGMSDARSYFDSLEDAIEAHNYRVKANPGKEIGHYIGQTGGLGDFGFKAIGHHEAR